MTENEFTGAATTHTKLTDTQAYYAGLASGAIPQLNQLMATVPQSMRLADLQGDIQTAVLGAIQAAIDTLQTEFDGL
jgi:hypothetical protein